MSRREAGIEGPARMETDDVKQEVDGTYIAPPIQRAVKLLRQIARGDTVSNMNRTARLLDINRSTLFRLLKTLELEGLIEATDDGSGYRIGIGLMEIAAQSAVSTDLIQVAAPFLRRLAEQVGLSAHLGILDGTDVILMFRHTPAVPLTTNLQLGSRLPAHATTLGRIILAQLPPAEVTELYRGRTIAALTPKVPSNLKQLHAMLDEDRKLGLAHSFNHYLEGIASIAAPIFGQDGKVVASLNVVGSIAAFDETKKNYQQLADAVRTAGIEISRRVTAGATFRSREQRAPGIIPA